MNISLKMTLGLTAIIILTVVMAMLFGGYLMTKEDTYGDLVHFNEKVEDGDLIFRCRNTSTTNKTVEFNEYGVIAKSLSSVYVWDNRNTLKRPLYEWAAEANEGKVQVYRLKDLGFDTKNLQTQNGTFTYLMNSDKMEFITEN